MQSNQQSIIFTFRTTEVRTVVRDGEVWFVASDVAKALAYRIADDMTRMLDDDEKGTQIVRTPGGDQQMQVINESGLYHAVLKSRKPEAKPFRKWVTSEVLPAIRKTGRYESTPYAVNSGDTLTKDEADTLRAMLTEAAERLPKDRQKALMLQGWSKLKAHFKTDYRHIPRAEFPEAVSLVARHIAGFAAAPADDLIPKSHALRCFALASAVTTSAQAAALSQLLDCGEDEVRHGRFLVTFCNGVPKVLAIERDAHVASLSRLAEMIAEPNGILPSNAELANLAKACVDRIAARINSAIEVREAA